MNGSVNNKVVFTDIADDSAGGDSNNDGNATAPTSSWRGIRFEDQSVDSINKIEYAEIRFAGNYNTTGEECLKFKNSGGNINNVSVIFGGTGLGVYGTANPNFQNITLQNLHAPIRMDMFANPVFGPITANNIGVMGILIPTASYSQSGTFPLRNFAGYANITYVIESEQTVNGGTAITIPAGMSFKSALYVGGYYTAKMFNVLGRLNVGGTLNNPVVFTRLEDDSYGNPADIESNGNSSIPYLPNADNQSYLYYLNYPDVADDSSTINYAIFRYSSAGITCLSSSPIISNCNFAKCNYGISLSGTSTPVVNLNSFADFVCSQIKVNYFLDSVS